MSITIIFVTLHEEKSSNQIKTSRNILNCHEEIHDMLGISRCYAYAGVCRGRAAAKQ